RVGESLVISEISSLPAMNLHDPRMPTVLDKFFVCSFRLDSIPSALTIFQSLTGNRNQFAITLRARQTILLCASAISDVNASPYCIVVRTSVCLISFCWTPTGVPTASSQEQAELAPPSCTSPIVRTLVEQYRVEKEPTRKDTRRSYEVWMRHYVL